MRLILKNLLAGETGVRGFSKSEENFFFLMKTVGVVLPYRLRFYMCWGRHATLEQLSVGGREEPRLPV
jgi:hypothetical protein